MLADTRSVVARDRSEAAAQERPDAQFRRTQSRVEAVAVPVTATNERSNPFLNRRDLTARPFLGDRPSSGFLAQAIGQQTADGAAPPGNRAAEEAAQTYRSVQETVDRAAGGARPDQLEILA